MRFFPPLLFVALLLSGCGKDSAPVADQHAEDATTTTHSEDITLTPEAIQIAGIETAEARIEPMQAELLLPGVVTNTAQGRAVVTSPADGKVVRLHVGPGATVKAGQPIATVQSSNLAESSATVIEAERALLAAEAATREAKSAIELAQAHQAAATAALGRQKQFAKAGAFNQPAIHQSQRDMNGAEAELESATREHELHQSQLERAERLYKQELISRTDLEQARLEVHNDKIRTERARRDIEIARASLERERQIVAQGLSNSREIQSAEAEVRAATLEVEQAKIRFRSAQSGVAGAQKGILAARTSYSAQSGGAKAAGGIVTIVAPISGVVTHQEVTVGQAVERTTEICEIENLKSVWVTASVPEKEIGKVRVGGPAQIVTKAHPGRIFQGVVQVMGSRLDAKSRTMPVQVLVDNTSGALRADMFATVAVGVGLSDPALAIPRAAIVDDGDRRLIYVAEEDGKFEERVVETGRFQGELIEILSGIEPGMRVVVKGAFVLKSEKVKASLKGHED